MPLQEEELHELMAAAEKGTQQLITLQRQILGDVTLKKKAEGPKTAGS